MAEIGTTKDQTALGGKALDLKDQAQYQYGEASMPNINCPQCNDQTFVFRGWSGTHRCRACGARLIMPIDTDSMLVETVRQGFGTGRRFDPRQHGAVRN